MSKKKPPAKLSRAVAASPAARKTACAVLEVLAGLKGPTEAAEALSVSLNRYYVLEARALEGLVKALEPRPRGRAQTVEQKVRELTAEVKHLTRELERSKSVLRMTERTVGLPAPRKKKKVKRKVNRSKKVLKLLNPPTEEKVS